MSREKAIIKEVMSMLGKRSAEKLTKTQRVERAKNAVNTRWNKRKNNAHDTGRQSLREEREETS